MTEALSVTDEQLMERLKATGDRDAFSQLIARYKHTAYRYCLAWLGNPADAMDAAQNSFLRLFQGAGRYETGRPFRPWLLAIVRRCAQTEARTRWRWGRRKAGDESLAEPVADGREDATAAERWRAAWRRVAQLPAEQREVLLLRHVEGLSYDEIAAALRVPRGTVARRLHEARRGLGSFDEL